jgi:ribosomal protein S18 acetylase RimI-like enzyme
MLIRPLTKIKYDIAAVAAVQAQAFPRQLNSLEWITCNAQAYPRMRYFVAVVEDDVVGYVLWTEKSGFRKDVVLELEQIAVLPAHQRQGIAEELIRQSLPHVTAQLEARGSTLNTIIVTTRTDNAAQRLYARVLGAEVEATIPNLFGTDEVVMVCRR